MLNYEDKGYEKFPTEETIKYLVSFLEERDDWENPKKYVILEYFPIGKGKLYKPKVYELTNLTMALDNDTVYCDDGYKILENDTLSLRNFLTDSVIYIGFQTDRFTISFEYGYIQIYY